MFVFLGRVRYVDIRSLSEHLPVVRQNAPPSMTEDRNPSLGLYEDDGGRGRLVQHSETQWVNKLFPREREKLVRPAVCPAMLCPPVLGHHHGVGNKLDAGWARNVEPPGVLARARESG